MTLSRIIRLTRQHQKEKKAAGIPRTPWQSRALAYPFMALMHPVKTFQQLKYEGEGLSVPVANGIFLLLFIGQIFNYLNTGYLFNYNRAENLNLWLQFMASAMPALLWCVTNWAICTLMDGEGKFREIWVCTAYSFFPVVLRLFLGAILSNGFIVDEGAFLTVLEVGTLLLTVLMLFISNMIIQQYTFKKTVISMLLTVCGIAAMIFLMILMLSMFQQLGTFLSTVYKETLQRIRGG